MGTGQAGGHPVTVLGTTLVSYPDGTLVELRRPIHKLAVALHRFLLGPTGRAAVAEVLYLVRAHYYGKV